MITKQLFLTALLFFISFNLFSQSILSDKEVQQYKDELGIELTESQKNQIAKIVKPTGTLPQWRIDADNRIEQNRKAMLAFKITDSNGEIIKNANITVKLKKNAFKFGGVVDAADLTDDKKNLNSSGTSIEYWEKTIKALFNAIGAGNNFKPRLTNGHKYLPDFLKWAESQKLDVRGHLLMWPGSEGIEEMDKEGSEIGKDYGKHLSKGWQDPLSNMLGYENVTSYNVTGAVETFKTSERTVEDKKRLKEVVDAEIKQWSSLWNVYEWDVINETLNNRLLMDILGYEQMAEWFKIAKENAVNPECKLVLNDYQIVSAVDDPNAPNWANYENRKAIFMSRIDQIIADGGKIDRIGFQNRYKFGVPNPELTYSRLDEFAKKYSLMMVGTEFEVIDNINSKWNPYDYSEEERAKITEQTLTIYYSHPKTTGLFNWTFMHANDEKALAYYNGTIKLNGLVWYYLHRIRYSSNEQAMSDQEGKCTFRGFKGKYDVFIEHDGKQFQTELNLDNDIVYSLTLNSDVIDIDILSLSNQPVKDINNNIVIFPNPVNDTLHIKSNKPIEKIEIISINGKVISLNNDTKKINISHLSNGSYILKCKQGTNIIVKQFLKTK